MDDTAGAQTLGKREAIENLDREFAHLHARLLSILENTSDKNLYLSSSGENRSLASVGESVLRCAAAIEQTFGGITANLWDDPFEWTLPEYLSTPAKVVEHLKEVETMRARAFSSFRNDDCLSQLIAIPSGETRPLRELLSDTLKRAAHHLDQARQHSSALQTLSGITPSGFII